MTNVNYDYIENYIRSLIIEKDKNLKSIRKYAEEKHIPIVEEETEALIKYLIALQKPKKILELGTAIGYSAISFAMASKAIEKIVTVEINEDMYKLAKKNIKAAKLESLIDIYLEDAYIFLNKTRDNFDLIFIDAAKGQYENYFYEAKDHLNKDGIIICDNVLFKGMIANDDLVKKRKNTIVRRLREFLEKIEKDDKFISSIVPIGDGVLLVRRVNE